MECDLIIVGAGPAGLSTALYLQKLAPDLAARTVILERAHHPRRKLCAGAVMPGGEAWLQKLGLSLDDVPSVVVQEARFLFEGRGFVIKRSPAVFTVVAREAFDAWVADEVRSRGLELHEDVCARRVLVQANGVEVETDAGVYRARAVVGADGVNGVVRRAIAPRGQSGLARLLEVRAERSTGEALSTQRTQSCATLDFSRMAQGVQGYAWDFPAHFGQSPGCSLGIFDSRISSVPVSGSLDPFLQQFADRRGVDIGCQQVESWPLRRFRRDGVFSAGRVLLVGDAAGVDPLLGEGISFALGYGDVAARELADAFKREDYSFRDYRRHVLTHRVGRYLLRRSRVASLIYRIHKERLLRFLWWTFGPVVGRLAEGFLVDWGE